MKPSERVILVKGDATKWYNQAIFIVNQNAPATKMPVDFVAEAERIIFNHISSQKKRALADSTVATQGAYTSHGPMDSYASAPGRKTTAPARRSAARGRATTFDFVLNVVMILACIAIVAVLVYGFLS